MMRRTMTKARAPMARFLRGNDGVAAVEFALIAPLLVVFLLGTTMATQSLWAHGKVSQTSSVIGDLISQENSLTNADFTAIMRAGPVLLEPFPISDLNIEVTAAIACHQNPDDTAGSTPRMFVVWSNGWQNGAITNSGQRPGTELDDAPTELAIQDSDYVIQTSASYTYVPAISQKAGYQIDMKETAYHQPRDQQPVSYPSREGNDKTRDCDELMNR